MCPCRPQHLPALRRRQPTPEVERGERDSQRACRAKARHRAIFAYWSEPGLLAFAVSMIAVAIPVVAVVVSVAVVGAAVLIARGAAG